MATMVQQVCWCGKRFEARAADVKRGWGKACCKKHAARAGELKGRCAKDTVVIRNRPPVRTGAGLHAACPDDR